MTKQMKKLTGKSPVTDCYHEPWLIYWLVHVPSADPSEVASCTVISSAEGLLRTTLNVAFPPSSTLYEVGSKLMVTTTFRNEI